ncbi:cellulose binding domain-containing protein [Planosporangium thailandense]|nr:cellulose binding domain-containing protein [Planosporangium thailandense]
MRPRSARILLAAGAATLVAGAAALLTETVTRTAFATTDATVTFSKAGSSNGYTGIYTIKNSGSDKIKGWTLTFDLPAGTRLGAYRDAHITSNGVHHTARNREYNATITPGASVSFSFVASGTGEPTNCGLNGDTCVDTRGSYPSPSPALSPRPAGGDRVAKLPAAPYLYLGWGDPPSATSVMSASGIKAFTMAFMLSGGGCNPMWDGSRPLTGGVDQQTINAVRAAGGDVEVSFGGWSGNKLGPSCPDDAALAGAYQKVIDAYRLKVVDIDIENSDEFGDPAVQDRILGALKIVKERNPGVTTVLTFGTGRTGPTDAGVRLINRSKALSADVDVYTIMPFDFDGTDMYTDTVNATEGLKDQLKRTFGWPDATAYGHMGISGRTGVTAEDERIPPQTWTDIRDYAKNKGLVRLAFWSANRDRPCPGGGASDSCSGMDQSDWEFTRISAGF